MGAQPSRYSWKQSLEDRAGSAIFHFGCLIDCLHVRLPQCGHNYGNYMGKWNMQLHVPSSKNLGTGNCQRPQGDSAQKRRSSAIPGLGWRMCSPPASRLMFSISSLSILEASRLNPVPSTSSWACMPNLSFWIAFEIQNKDEASFSEYYFMDLHREDTINSIITHY